MNAEQRGTIAIPWDQTETDGHEAAPEAFLRVGASWCWRGRATRLDGPAEVLPLRRAVSHASLHERASRKVHRLFAAWGGAGARRPVEEGPPLLRDDSEVLLTDGRRAYRGVLIAGASGVPALIAFDGDAPPAGAEAWVVRRGPARGVVAVDAPQPQALMCFTPGTRVATDGGTRDVALLEPGDRVLTRDDGAQRVQWVGRCHVSGARLHSFPSLRPIRLRAGALGQGRPDSDLLLSRRHRVLVRGRAAEALFGTSEVLVAAEDLVGDRGITVDHRATSVTYVHVMFERHQIIWANGLEAESFRPERAALDALAPDQRAALLCALGAHPDGPIPEADMARRALSAPEAAILRHDGAGWH